jgi:proteic killer suppression protein
MIISFEHKGLALFFQTGSVSGIQPIHASRLRVMLSVHQVAKSASDLNRPSWRLHGLTGNLKGYLSLTVQANWRLTFKFIGPDVDLLNYCDYH